MSICLWIIKRSGAITFPCYSCPDSVESQTLDMKLMWPRLLSAGCFPFFLACADAWETVWVSVCSGRCCGGSLAGEGLSGLASYAGSPSCYSSGCAVVSGCTRVSSVVGSASAAIMPHLEPARVVLDMQWARGKMLFINFERKNELGFRAWSPLAVHMLSCCRK